MILEEFNEKWALDYLGEYTAVDYTWEELDEMEWQANHNLEASEEEKKEVLSIINGLAEEKGRLENPEQYEEDDRNGFEAYYRNMVS